MGNEATALPGVTQLVGCEAWVQVGFNVQAAEVSMLCRWKQHD